MCNGVTNKFTVAFTILVMIQNPGRLSFTPKLLFRNYTIRTILELKQEIVCSVLGPTKECQNSSLPLYILLDNTKRRVIYWKSLTVFTDNCYENSLAIFDKNIAFMTEIEPLKFPVGVCCQWDSVDITLRRLLTSHDLLYYLCGHGTLYF